MESVSSLESVSSSSESSSSDFSSVSFSSVSFSSVSSPFVPITSSTPSVIESDISFVFSDILSLNGNFLSLISSNLSISSFGTRFWTAIFFTLFSDNLDKSDRSFSSFGCSSLIFSLSSSNNWSLSSPDWKIASSETPFSLKTCFNSVGDLSSILVEVLSNSVSSFFGSELSRAPSINSVEILFCLHNSINSFSFLVSRSFCFRIFLNFSDGSFSFTISLILLIGTPFVCAFLINSFRGILSYPFSSINWFNFSSGFLSDNASLISDTGTSVSFAFLTIALNVLSFIFWIKDSFGVSVDKLSSISAWDNPFSFADFTSESVSFIFWISDWIFSIGLSVLSNDFILSLDIFNKLAFCTSSFNFVLSSSFRSVVSSSITVSISFFLNKLMRFFLGLTVLTESSISDWDTNLSFNFEDIFDNDSFSISFVFSLSNLSFSNLSFLSFFSNSYFCFLSFNSPWSLSFNSLFTFSFSSNNSFFFFSLWDNFS